jgi:hypothetical protein
MNESSGGEGFQKSLLSFYFPGRGLSNDEWMKVAPAGLAAVSREKTGKR